MCNGIAKNIFEEGELQENMVVRKIWNTTQHEAIEDNTQAHEVNYYNLDNIKLNCIFLKNFNGLVWLFPKED